MPKELRIKTGKEEPVSNPPGSKVKLKDHMTKREIAELLTKKQDEIKK